MTFEEELESFGEAEKKPSPIKKRRAKARKGPARVEAAPEIPPEPEVPAVPLPPIVNDAMKLQLRLIERRLINPVITDDRSITLRDKNLVIRIFDGNRPGRLYHAVHRLGWRPLHVEELVDREQIGDLSTTKEGYVVRGEKGREMYCVMPRDAFDAIQRKKVQVREKKQNLHSKSRREQLDDIAEATAGKFGDEAGETVRRFRGTNPDQSVVMDLDS